MDRFPVIKLSPRHTNWDFDKQLFIQYKGMDQEDIDRAYVILCEAAKKINEING